MLFLENVATMGVDVLEMNVNMTGDGHIVINHDITVDETTDGTGVISDMTLAEVRPPRRATYDWTQDDGATYPYRGQGIVIPTLEEVFQTFPDFAMIVEIKQRSPSMAQPLCDLIPENMGWKRR